MTSSFKPNVGDVILNKYECISLVGEGAFGCVYRARDIKLGRVVAIKFINATNGVLKRFGDELDAIKNLDHPNIVRLYDYDILKGGIPCMVMEFVNGQELGEILSQEGAFSLSRICDIALQVLDALVETHNHEIIHCDLKPENIMLTSVGARTNVVKLIDFGVAALLEKTTADAERQKLLIGTPQYMAPEQIRHEQLGPWTDNYALGLILIELFSGKFVFDHEDPREILKMQLFQPAILPHELAVSELGPIISRAVEKDVEKRYQNTQEFYEDVRNAIQQIQISEHSRPINKARLNSMDSVMDDLEDFTGYGSPKSPEPGARRLPTQMRMLNFDYLEAARSNESSVPLEKPRSVCNSVPLLDGLSISDSRVRLQSMRQQKQSATVLASVSPVDGSLNSVSGGRVHVPTLSPSPQPAAEPPKAAEEAADVDLSSLQNIISSEGRRIPTSTLSGDVSVQLDAASHVDMADKGRVHVPTLSEGLKSANNLKPISAQSSKTVHNPNAAPKSAPKAKNRIQLAILISMLILMILGGGCYWAWKSGILEEMGIIESTSPVPGKERVVVGVPEPQKNADEIVRFSTIRDAAKTMAFTGAISGQLGASPSVKKIVHYRVVGSPTDAAVYLDERRVCGKTPCDVHVYGNPAGIKLGIRKGGKSKAVDLAQQNPADPVILVLGKN